MQMHKLRDLKTGVLLRHLSAAPQKTKQNKNKPHLCSTKYCCSWRKGTPKPYLNFSHSILWHKKLLESCCFSSEDPFWCPSTISGISKSKHLMIKPISASLLVLLASLSQLTLIKQYLWYLHATAESQLECHWKKHRQWFLLHLNYW